VIYACLQNGTWSADIGKVFRSSDGGDTWEDWTGSVSEYLKCIVVQPTSTGNDLVYLFANATNGNTGKVFYRKEGMTDWAEFDNNYPAGMTVNLALPFFRDSKLRVAGNGSVWESPMSEPEFKPIVNPWIEKTFYNCMLDTLFFEDHSILNHSGATWQWSITPAPAYIDNPTIRNPKVVLGNPGSFSVTLTVTQNGESYTKSITDMVTTTTCPSIYDCNNPAELPKNEWKLIYVDSEELNYPGYATMSFDGDPETIWHTRWSTGDDPYPHEIQVDLGKKYSISNFTYLTRQDGENGRIKAYELYISEDSLDWGMSVKMGEFVNTGAPQTIIFDTVKVGQYFRLVALSEVNGNPWASAAEFSMVGCIEWPAGNDDMQAINTITAFPVPTNSIVNVALPSGDKFYYRILSSTGLLIDKGVIDNPSGTFSFDLGNHAAGFYFVTLTDDQGVTFRVKVVKK
jgi:PKD repeat protein